MVIAPVAYLDTCCVPVVCAEVEAVSVMVTVWYDSMPSGAFGAARIVGGSAISCVLRYTVMVARSNKVESTNPTTAPVTSTPAPRSQNCRRERWCEEAPPCSDGRCRCPGATGMLLIDGRRGGIMSCI